jgi:hypothetical protein
VKVSMALDRLLCRRSDMNRRAFPALGVHDAGAFQSG